MKKKKQHGPSALHAHMWSSLTFAGFITSYIAAILLGARGILPFVYGGAMLLFILLVEGLLHGGIWPTSETYHNVFKDVDGVALRLVFFCGGLLLIMETSILIHFFW